MKKYFILTALIMALFACNQNIIKENGMKTTVSRQIIDQTVRELELKFPEADKNLLQRGVQLTSQFWIEEDGTPAEFKDFCLANFDPQNRKLLLERFSSNLETVIGNYSRISTNVQFPLHVGNAPLLPVDEIFASWSPFARLSDDWFDNKLALILHLNFPYYSLEERNTQGMNWTEDENAAVNLGLNFASRAPGKLSQKANETATRAEMYISGYNIYMNNVVDEKGNKYFPEDMRLISHWGLRDELKSNYADKSETGLLKQKLIYELMLRIISQDIPQEFINAKGNDYCPINNSFFKDGKETAFEREKDVRYAFLLEVFKSEKAFDSYSPLYPDAIKRAFDQGLEMTFEEVENIFTTFLSAPVNREIGEYISAKLGRHLQPYDIWYDGFKTRSSISDDDLTAKTAKMFPNAKALEKYLPEILQILGYTKERATEICRHVAVDAARGSGHAMGTGMKGDTSRLRVRVPETGFNYNGFNIAMHEFGHNVEQTISMYDVDNFLNTGIPNTAFTEALAFVFQKRDLDVLGFTESNPDKQKMTTLDIYWGALEIMGVSLVDMYAWKWMYANPDATPEQLKAAVTGIANEIWNKYFAPIFGIKDSPVLAIYSHMISYPLYLAAYPVGHLIEFQLEQHLMGKDFPTEIDRIYRIGHRSPVVWMTKAVGSKLSAEAFISAATDAIHSIR